MPVLRRFYTNLHWKRVLLLSLKLVYFMLVIKCIPKANHASLRLPVAHRRTRRVEVFSV